MRHYGVPGAAVVVLRNGEIVHAAGYGVREAGTTDRVDADTLFSVGSVSKIVTATTSLRIAAKSTVDIDRDIKTYLTSWQVPSRQDLAHPIVTLRMLMSHTSGFGQHGFSDYQPNEPLPSTLQTLNGEKPAKNAPIRIESEPGTRMDYSGGGVMIEQVVLQDVTGMPFEQIVRQEVFDPLGMKRSTFENPLSADRGNIAKAHDARGAVRAVPQGWESFPESAASGLWTSANNLGSLVRALIRSYQGKGDFLPRHIATDMMTEVSPSEHGLGPRLYGSGAMRVFHHGGANDSYLAWIEGHLESGDGLVVLTNGAGGGELYDEIRNAVADSYGWGTSRAVYAIEWDKREAAYRDYEGTFIADESVPQAIQRALNEFARELKISAKNGQLSASRPDGSRTIELLPLTPNRFVAPGIPIPAGPLQIEFHRDAKGTVNVLTIETETSLLYYTRR
jgi:CubicO group peptidase (beta-lactamase class C family)